MVHKHKGWTVEVSDDPDFRGDHFDAAFSTTIRSAQECEVFTLFDDDRPESENAILQIEFFHDDRVRVWTYDWCMVQVYLKEKVVLVGVVQQP